MKSIRHFFGIVLLLTLYSVKGKAQENQTVFNNLRMPFNPVVMGLGGQSVSIIGDNPSLLFSSPALFGPESTKTLSMSYSYGINKSSMLSSAYGIPIGDRGAIAWGIRYIGFPKMDRYTQEGIKEGKFTVNDLTLSTAFSYNLSDYFRAGISLNLMYGNIDIFNAFGIGTDLGVSYFNEENGLSIGFAFKNLGGLIKGYSDEHELLFGDFVIGLSKHLGQGPITLHLTAYDLNPKSLQNKHPDLSRLQRLSRHFIMGVDFNIKNTFWLAMGFNNKVNQDLYTEGSSKLGGLSLGAGMNFETFKVGLSLAKYHSSAFTIMTSFSTNFGKTD